MGVNPFDEPNVTEAKVATSALLAQHAAEGKLPAATDDTCEVGDVERIRAHLATATPADYVAFCAYVLRTPARDAAAHPPARRLPRPHAQRDDRRATARASCTRPASCTRAARTRASSCS